MDPPKADHRGQPLSAARERLPGWTSALAVVAHPDDESFGLGAVITTLVDAGTTVGVLCFTHGGASTVHGVAGDLASIRACELARAGRVLGAAPVRLLDYPDGALTDAHRLEMAARVVELATELSADGLVTFDSDGVTGHPDHVCATAAAVLAADRLDLPVLGWTLPGWVAAALVDEFGAGFTGHNCSVTDFVVPVDRTRQLAAINAHASQALPGSVLWRRLELLGDRECLRWLRDPHAHRSTDRTTS